MPKIKNTGHPFVDVGIAAITAHTGRASPEEVTEEDLVKVAEYITDNYVVPPLTSVLTMSLPNSAFTQPAFDVEKKREYAQIIRDGLRADAPHSDETCVYTGEPAMGVPLSFKDDLAPGRAFRQHIPMLTGEGTINFFPDGDAGLPISGVALLALQFMPMGCAKCGGRLLAVHSEDNRLTLTFARAFWKQNLTDIAKAQAAHATKLDGSVRSQRTLLVETLIEAERLRQEPARDAPTASITAYYFTNSGQGADLTMYHLPMQVIAFLRIAYDAEHRDAWSEVVQRAWQQPKKTATADGAAEAFRPRQNFLFEDLFDLVIPQQWGRFVRTYFLRIPRRTKGKDDPRSQYSLRNDLRLVSWPLVELFLRKVVLMDADRVAQIRRMGDRLAAYVREQGTTNKFFRNFYSVERPSLLRGLLIKANTDFVKAGQEPLFDMDGYINIFEEGIDVARPDWRLARDLVLMRMIDQLRDVLAQHPETIPDTEVGADADEN